MIAATGITDGEVRSAIKRLKNNKAQKLKKKHIERPSKQSLEWWKSAGGMERWFHHKDIKEGQLKWLQQLERNRPTFCSRKSAAQDNPEPNDGDNIDEILREKQNEVGSHRACVDNIFILMDIIEYSLEWRSSLYINYIEFEKAFDSLPRDPLWHFMSTYGIPEKFINIVKAMYGGFRCSVRHEGETS